MKQSLKKMTGAARGNPRRKGTASVEFALCAPVLFFIVAGLWEVGRITEVQNVLWNSAREAARDASLGESDLHTVASYLLAYLQSAEPTAFGKGHSTSIIAPVVTLPAGMTGYTCWDNTKNRELFTLMFKDFTTTTATDPTAMKQLDRYQIAIEVPYGSFGWVPVAQITGTTRVSVTVDWVSMVDSPFVITPYLPAQ